MDFDAAVGVVTELQLRREAEGLNRTELKDRLLDLAEKAGIRSGDVGALDESSIRGWECRRHVPCALYACLLCDYFEVPSIALLGLGGHADASEWWTLATPAQRRLEVYRRELLAKGLVTVAAALLPVDAAIAAAQQLAGARRITSVEVEAARQAATALAVNYHARPDNAATAALVAHARTLGWQLKRASFTPGTRAGLEVVASDAAALAGHTAMLQGRREEADRWYDDAVRLARQAGDRRLEALAVASTSLTASETPNPTAWRNGDRSRSLTAVQDAAAIDHQTAAGTAWIQGNLARELAYAGDDAGSGRALEQMETAADRAAGEDPGWGNWSQHADFADFTGARSVVTVGVRLGYLGRHADAVALHESALAEPAYAAASPNRRAGTHRALASALVFLDEPEEAAAHLGAALDLVEAHGLVKPELTALRAVFPAAWEPLNCVKAVDERLRRC